MLPKRGYPHLYSQRVDEKRDTPRRRLFVVLVLNPNSAVLATPAQKPHDFCVGVDHPVRRTASRHFACSFRRVTETFPASGRKFVRPFSKLPGSASSPPKRP